MENLTPWQPKKLYFFSDAEDQKRFVGTGPAYSVKEISPSQQKPYWRLALDAATPHLTQFPAEIHQMGAMNDEQLTKFMDDPQHMWWTEPMPLTLGKSANGGATVTAGDVFAGIVPGQEVAGGGHFDRVLTLPAEPQIYLGGPWRFYREFWQAHGLINLPGITIPEIAVKSGLPVGIPLLVTHDSAVSTKLVIKTNAPDGWKITSGDGQLALPAERQTALRVEVQTPELSADDVKKSKPQEIVVSAEMNGKSIGEVRLRVLLKSSALAP